MARVRLSSERSTSIRAWRRPPDCASSSRAMTRTLLKMGNSSPRDISVILMSSMNDGILSLLLRAAVRDVRIDGGSFEDASFRL